MPANLPLELTTFIDLFANIIMRGGVPLEEEIRSRERDNRYFSFLFAPWNDPVNVYYRWRLYSLLQGDTLVHWRTEPFQMEKGSKAIVWVPPPVRAVVVAPPAPATPSSGVALLPPPPMAVINAVNEDGVVGSVLIGLLLAKEGGRNLYISLPDAERTEWISMLRSVTLQSDAVGDAMVFAVEHAEAALDVMSILLEAIVSPNATLVQLLSRLFVLSDILMNVHCSAPNSKSLGKAAELILPTVLDAVCAFVMRTVRKEKRSEKAVAEAAAAPTQPIPPETSTKHGVLAPPPVERGILGTAPPVSAVETLVEVVSDSDSGRLLGWLKVMCNVWQESGAISLRTASEMQMTHGFLFEGWKKE